MSTFFEKTSVGLLLLITFLWSYSMTSIFLNLLG